MAANAVTAPSQGASNRYRWMQLIVGLICMAMMANLQYGWTYFVGPMAKANQWQIGSIQVAFSIFIALETWLTPVQGWIVDSLGVRGPKFMVAAGGIAAALGWLINSKATSLEALYVGAAISGIGAGGVYATCVGNAVKWFPDRRGLAVGMTAAGIRCWSRRHRHPHSKDDRIDRLRGYLLLVRARSRRRCFRAGLAAAGAAPG